jgi:hypothetical protein
MRSLDINMLVDKFAQKMLEDRRNLNKIIYLLGEEIFYFIRYNIRTVALDE